MAGRSSNQLQINFQLWFRQTLRCWSLVLNFNISNLIEHLFRADSSLLTCHPKCFSVMCNTMRHLMIIAFTFICLSLFGQTSTTYLLKDIGWTIKLPSDFKLDDSSVISKDSKEGIIILENESHLKVDDASAKNLISASKNIFNQFNVTLSKSSAPNEHYWDSVNNRVLKIFYNAMVKQAPPQAKADSSRTIETIDAITFKSFKMEVKINDDLKVYNYIITRLYKGSTISINYNYTDRSAGEEIKKMLRESKFAK